MNSLFFIFSLVIVAVLSLGLQSADASDCISSYCYAQVVV